MNKETVKLKKAAMLFVDDSCFSTYKLAEADGGTPKLDMLVYSGGIIKNHWYWGDLAIDLSGMSFPKKKMPILEDHMTDQKIGFATKMSTDNHQLTVAEATLLNTPESIAFQQNSAAGFPYEASMYARPTIVESLSDGETAEVNGFIMKGPGSIWRKSIFKEASVCTFGYDPNTKSVAMTEDEECEIEFTTKLTETHQPAVKINKKEETKVNVIEQFKTDHPEEYKTLVDQITGTVTVTLTDKFNGEKAALEEKLTAATTQVTQLSEVNKANETRLVALEKTDLLRKEKDLKLSADNIFDAKFTEVGVAPRLHDKIRKLVSHEQFIKEGELDTEAFSAAVDAELKDWATEEKGESSVAGFSVHSKNFDNGAGAEQFTVDATAERMAKYVRRSEPTA